MLQQGEGQARVQHSDFSLEPPRPKLPAHFGAVLEADGHGLKSCQVSRPLGNLYSARPNPLKIPSCHHDSSCFQAHVNLSFRSPPWASSPATLCHTFSCRHHRHQDLQSEIVTLVSAGLAGLSRQAKAAALDACLGTWSRVAGFMDVLLGTIWDY